MTISPDNIVLWEWNAFHLNLTILWTWVIMFLLSGGSWLISRRLSTGPKISRWQNLLEALIISMRNQIRGVSRFDSDRYLPFVGTLFLFIFTANVLGIVPGYWPPTGSLSTTTALALCVFISVPVFGIAHEGLFTYLKHYVRPTPLMLPFNLIGEISRTIALAVRLYGNVMSATITVGLLLTLMPFFFPILMKLLGLITGAIQAFIFAILAMVYIASASAAHTGADAPAQENAADSKMNLSKKGEPHGKS